jgi:thioredoxin 1
MTAIDVTDENLQRILQSKKTILIDFGAEWCPPCRAMKPVIDSLAEEFNSDALIGTLDVDANPHAPAKYGVRNLPTFLIFKNGTLRDRIVGAVPKILLQQKLKALT